MHPVYRFAGPRRWVAATACLLGMALSSGGAAQPPEAQGVTRQRVDFTRASTRSARAISLLERIGGAHAAKAMRVAQGVPTGRVALRPMFWMTRDQRGAMFALGGRF